MIYAFKCIIHKYVNKIRVLFRKMTQAVFACVIVLQALCGIYTYSTYSTYTIESGIDKYASVYIAWYMAMLKTLACIALEKLQRLVDPCKYVPCTQKRAA